jgi:hypothetical protein
MATAAMGLASGGLGLLSGWLSARAAKKAAEIQAAAAAKVGAQAVQTADEEAGRVTAAGEGAATGVSEAAVKAGAGMWLSADDANALLRSIYGDNMAALEPYQATGANAVRTLNAATGPGGDFNKTFTGADLESDPGVQFRIAKAQQALERSRSSIGVLGGGRFAKELDREIQGVASDEFGKAFERFRSDRADRYGMLYNLATVGQRATETGIGAGETYGGRAAGNIMTAGKYEGDVNTEAARQAGTFKLGSVGDAANLRMRGLDIWGNATAGGANANAAGTIGASNAWATGLSQVGRTAMDLAYLNANPWASRKNIPGMPPTVAVPGTTINPNNMTYDPVTGEWVYKP